MSLEAQQDEKKGEELELGLSDELRREYEQQLAQLHAALAEKDQELSDLQRGVEAQVRMVMELEELEQKELQQYELKLQANQQLIQELGDRVGQETKAKAELQSQLSCLESQVMDQQVQLENVMALNKVNAELLAAMKHEQEQGNSSANPNPNNPNPSTSTSSNSKKLEYMMETNQKLVMELAQVQEDKQQMRREVSDKEMLCLELSSQLDKLATQLNNSDELMAGVKHQLKAKEKELKAALSRVEFLERSILESETNHSTADEEHAEEALKGAAALMKALKKKEEQCQQLQKERDASLAKATKLSLALASSREHVDSLQEKLEYQDSIVDRILGKRNSHSHAHSHHTTSVNNTSPTSHTANNHDTTTANAADKTTPKRQSSGDGSSTSASPFDGRRIRSFFHRAGAGAGAGNASATATATGTAAANTTTPTTEPKKSTPARSFSGRIFQRKKSEEVVSAGGAATTNSINNDANHTKPKSTTITSTTAATNPNSHPFDDHGEEESFTNPSVGKESHVDEHIQGGGGDVNLALTL